MYYENLIIEDKAASASYPESLERHLKLIIRFLDFEWDTERFKCLLNDNEGNFHRRRACIDKGSLGLASFNSYMVNGKHTMDIYQKKHITWINSAISSIQLAFKKRSIDSTCLSDYKSNHVKIIICP